MAFTVEEISKIIAGEGNDASDVQQELATKLVALHDEDVKGLKYTNQQLKEEKTLEIQKRHEDSDRFAALEASLKADIKKAQDLASQNNPEEAKKYYETQLSQVESGYRAQIEARDKTILEKEDLIKNLQKKDLLRSQEAEFMKEIQKTKADPLTYDVIKTMVLGESGDKFAPHETADGVIFWANDNSGETIKNRLEKILNSDLGKRFVMYNSSGAGAEGSAGSVSVANNPFKTGNLTEQQRLYREDPKQYELLKKQALSQK